MSKVRVGLLGFGLAGRLLHAPFIHTAGGFEIVAVSTSRAEQVKAEYPSAQVCADVEEVIARSDVDLVVVTTPHRLHVAHAHAALEAGKHVVVEKPITSSPEEMQALIATASAADRLLIPYQQRRYDGDFRTVQQIVASGILGRIHYFESHWIMYRPRPRGVWRETVEEQGGIFYDLGPHLIDHTLQLFGRPDAVYAQIQANRGVIAVDDLFRVNLHYSSGLHVLLETDNLNPQPAPRFAVRGLNGAFVKHGLDPQEARLRAGLRPQDEHWGKDDPENWGQLFLRIGDQLTTTSRVETLPGDYRLYWKAVYNAIAHGQPPPVAAADILPQIEIINAARLSAASGQAQPLGQSPDTL